jgi:chromosomal replication initiator protein
MKKADFENHLKTIPKTSTRVITDNEGFDPSEVWKEAKEYLKQIIGIREFGGLFGNVYIENINNGVVQISCEASYKREKILKDYQYALKNALKKTCDRNFEIEINLREKEKDFKKSKYEYHNPGEEKEEVLDLFSTAEKEKKLLEEALEESSLNPKYLFNNFIVGPNNRLAEAVAQAVLEDLGRAYNPVFYYGDTGVGKTHLMQAIGNEIIKRDYNKKVVYVSIEQFLNEMVEAISTKRNEQFRNKYRAVDLLIIDDIQFVEAFPRTQEELFHTFNTLYQANKQIILASDRPPKEIKNITDRLRSRFEGGMVADMQAPDYETRLAILRQALEERKTTIPDQYIELIAKNIESNIRELEGALTKVVSLFKLGVDPSFEDVSRILQIDLETKRKRITPKKVIDTVGEVFDVKISEIKGKRRTAYIAKCRQLVMYILRNELEMPLERVAKEVNRKDHTTVIHACEKIDSLREENSRFDEKVNSCLKMLRG